MKELVIIHQNINQDFCFYKDEKRIDIRNTPMIVAINLLDVAKEKNAHVIVCTEFKVLDNYKEAIEKPLTEAGYVIFKNEELKNLDKGKVETLNQVLIAVKNDIVNEQKSKINPVGLDQNDEKYSKIRYLLTYGNIGETPNYLRVDLDLNGKPYSIIGTRIRLLSSGGKEERTFRAKRLNVLLSSLPKDRDLIMVGDFNNSPSDHYRKQGSEWHFDEVYNKSLKNNKLVCRWPNDGHSPCGSNLKLDHIVVSDKLKVNEVEYFEGKYCQRSNTMNLPDHPILYAKIKLKTV